MIAVDEDALICDLAETYHILDYKSLPASLVATLCVGLKDDSRIKMKLRNEKVTANTLITALIHDRILDIAYAITGTKSKKEYLSSIYLTENVEFPGFDSPEEYEEARRKFMKGD